MLKTMALLTGFLLFGLSGCVAIMPPDLPARNPQPGDLLLDASFEPGVRSNDDWQEFSVDFAALSVVNGTYQARLTRVNYIWGLYQAQTYSNVIVEADALLISADDQALYGVRCRASVANPANGYYFMISGDGNYSIRYGAGNAIDPLVKWQASGAIRRGRQPNTLRAICDGDYLALYINGEFVAEVTDTRYREGYTGIALALPPSGGDVAEVAYERLRVWSVR